MDKLFCDLIRRMREKVPNWTFTVRITNAGVLGEKEEGGIPFEGRDVLLGFRDLGGQLMYFSGDNPR